MRGWGCEGDFAATISFSKKENTECVSDPLEITPETKQENPMAIKISSIFMFAITQELSGSGFIPNQLEYNNKARSSKLEDRLCLLIHLKNNVGFRVGIWFKKLILVEP